jgi:hypothetical protein
MGAVFVSHQLATKPMWGVAPDQWSALAAFSPVLVFLPLAIFLMARVKT